MTQSFALMNNQMEHTVSQNGFGVVDTTLSVERLVDFIMVLLER